MQVCEVKGLELSLAQHHQLPPVQVGKDLTINIHNTTQALLIDCNHLNAKS